jgi:hypothetical protein
MKPSRVQPQGAESTPSNLSSTSHPSVARDALGDDPLVEAEEALLKRPEFAEIAIQETMRAARVRRDSHVPAAVLYNLVDTPRDSWPPEVLTHLETCLRCDGELGFLSGLSPYTTLVRKAIARLDAEIAEGLEPPRETALDLPLATDVRGDRSSRFSPDPAFDARARELARLAGYGAATPATLEEAFEPPHPQRA